MRDTEERVQAALLGAKRIQRRQTKTWLQRTVVTAYALALCLVAGLGYTIPAMLATSQNSAVPPGFFASVFADSQVLSYIVIGILSFLLGICVTVLCVLLRKKHREEEGEH